MHRHFRGVGTRNQVRCPYQVQKMLEIEPSTTLHYLFFHHRNVRSRATKADYTKLEEEASKLAEASDA